MFWSFPAPTHPNKPCIPFAGQINARASVNTTGCVPPEPVPPARLATFASVKPPLQEVVAAASHHRGHQSTRVLF
ncbi:hypothetical protein pipiens_006879 [Culex pipiens pipiens]|uniref:Uncharacterized protein n=1 Tax=Culex pipiens pipiens TaxID=38569 RepID=A0ABD1DMX1_CULPP